MTTLASARYAGWLVLAAAAFALCACTPASPAGGPTAVGSPTAARVQASVPAPSSTAPLAPAAIGQRPATVTPPKAGELTPSHTHMPSLPAAGTRPELPQSSSAAPPVLPSPPAATPAPAALASPDLPTLPASAAMPPAPTHTPGPTPAVDVIVDDADPGVSYSGAWYAGDGGASFRGGCRWAPPGPNFANFRPDLPVAGSYEIYAWGCGDPNHDQAYRTDVSIYPLAAGFYAPPRASVDLKDDAGRWVSIGTYYMEPGGWVGVGPWDARDWDAGNLAVDAFRFVFRSAARADVTPTPAPTRVTWTNHPPSPEAQLTAGDLAARLGLVQWLYPYTPAAFESATFDDCTAFPRAGCAGTREGWRVTVRYLGREPFEVTYRLSDDLRYVSLDAPDALRSRQLRYLAGQNGLRALNVYRYPDGTWHVNVADRTTGAGGSAALTSGRVAILEALAGKYASIGTGRERVVTPGGWELRLYGLGTRVALDEDDRGRLAALVDELGETMLP